MSSPLNLGTKTGGSVTGTGAIKPPVEPKVVPEYVTSAKLEDLSLFELTDDQILESASLIAKPLSVPEHLNVKPKDPNYIFRWVNRRGQDGSWYERMRAAGFLNATLEDCVGLSSEIMVKDGAIISYDCILMKMNRLVYLSAIKNNQLRAEAMVSRKNILGAALGEGKKAIAEAGIPAQYMAGKVGFFTPSAEQAESLLKSSK